MYKPMPTEIRGMLAAMFRRGQIALSPFSRKLLIPGIALTLHQERIFKNRASHEAGFNQTIRE